MLLVALGLRAFQLDYGLPWLIHPDERSIIAPALRMADLSEPDFDPQFYNYPALPIYTLALSYAVRDSVAGDAGWPDARTPSLVQAVKLARWVTTVFGLGTVVALYAAGCLMGSRRVGLLAALLLAVTPFHVLDSHYANVDVPMTFWLVVAFALALAFLKTGRPPWYLAAASCIGLASASKYTALVGVIMLAAACWLDPATRRDSRRALLLVVGGAGLAGVVFLAAAPYTLLRFDAVMQALELERSHLSDGQYGFDLSPDGWNYHRVIYQLSSGLPFVLGAPLFLLALAGAVESLRRPRREFILLWALFVPLFAGVSWVQLVFLRYLLPCIPFLVLLAAAFLSERLGGADSSRRLATALLIGVLIYTSAFTGSLLLNLDPQNGTRASRWILDNVERGSQIDLATGFAPHGMPPGRYGLHRLNLQRAIETGEGAEWLLINSWYETALERGSYRHASGNRWLKELGGEASDYERVARFESNFFSEGFYALFDPHFKNQFESPDYTVYRRRSQGSGELPPR